MLNTIQVKLFSRANQLNLTLPEKLDDRILCLLNQNLIKYQDNHRIINFENVSKYKNTSKGLNSLVQTYPLNSTHNVSNIFIFNTQNKENEEYVRNCADKILLFNNAPESKIIVIDRGDQKYYSVLPEIKVKTKSGARLRIGVFI
jgi:hypothetical protein